MNALTAVRHEPVAIAGYQVLAAIGNDEKAYFSPKHVCEAIGIAWQRQHEKIKSDPILAEGITIMVIPSSGGPQQTTMLPIEMAQGWLFTIKRVAPELQERLNRYRRECFHALHAWFAAQQPQQKTSPVTELDALEGIVAYLRRQDQRMDRIEMEVGQLRAITKPKPKRLALVTLNQVGLDLNPPAKPKGEPKGGTHASPCPHIRRGHWRRCRNGKRVWIKDARVRLSQAH